MIISSMDAKENFIERTNSVKVNGPSVISHLLKLVLQQSGESVQIMTWLMLHMVDCQMLQLILAGAKNLMVPILLQLLIMVAGLVAKLNLKIPSLLRLSQLRHHKLTIQTSTINFFHPLVLTHSLIAASPNGFTVTTSRTVR